MKMDEKTLELEMTALIKALVKRGWLIALGAVLGAAVMLAAMLFMGPKYQADVVLRVSNQTRADDIITWEDVSASRDLAESCAVLVNSRACLERVAERTGEDRETLARIVEASVMEDTEFLQVTVICSSKMVATNIANAVGDVLPELAADVLTGAEVRLVDEAAVPEKPCGPDYGRGAAVGLLLGLLLSCGAVVILEIRRNNKA